MTAKRYHYRQGIPPKNTQGVIDSFEFTLNFLAWCDGRAPFIHDMMNHFGVSRATAYRYRAAYQIWAEKQRFESSPKRVRILALLGVDRSLNARTAS